MRMMMDGTGACKLCCHTVLLLYMYAAALPVAVLHAVLPWQLPSLQRPQHMLCCTFPPSHVCTAQAAAAGAAVCR
jgi:hypothetical protein